jgi:hypothetical protein
VFIQGKRAAQARYTGKSKAQRQVYSPGYPDPCSDKKTSLRRAALQQKLSLAKPFAVICKADAECLPNAPWTRRDPGTSAPPFLHHCQAHFGPDRPDQDGLTRAANYIQAKMAPVRKVDIDGARPTEHRDIARCKPSEAV